MNRLLCELELFDYQKTGEENFGAVHPCKQSTGKF